MCFHPADTKGSSKGKFEGSGEAGVIAYYNMSPGYVWDGEYLCWPLKELAGIGMKAKASKYPPGIQSPHVTKRIRLPSGNSCNFPFKEKYDRQFRSVDGIVEIQGAKQEDSNVGSYLVCPDEHVDVDNPDKTVPTAGSSSSSGIPPPQPGWLDTSITSPKQGVLDTHDIHLGVGYEFHDEGHLCRRDTVNRLYRVDEQGRRILNRTTTCPPHLSSDTWWKRFSPADRAT